MPKPMTAEDRVKCFDADLACDGKQIIKCGDVHRAERARQRVIEAINTTVEMCCKLFREKCPACDNGHVCNGGESSHECQVCGEGLRHVLGTMGVTP